MCVAFHRDRMRIEWEASASEQQIATIVGMIQKTGDFHGVRE
jgi:hypothetical protein